MDDFLYTRYKCMYIVITGNIASGKSTIVNYIHKKYGYTIIPEFTCTPRGKQLLQSYLNKSITPIQFQCDILDIYNEMYNNISSTNVVFERLPEEGIEIFSYANNISEDDINILREHNNITICSKQFKVYRVKSDSTCIMKIDEIIQSNTNNVLILLYNDTNTLLDRIKQRGVEGENTYTYNYINTLSKLYDEYYKD